MGLEQMKQQTSRWLFWSALSLILYTYFIFPVVVLLRGLLRPRPVKKREHFPPVSLIVAAYNEASVIIQKLDNILALDYPRERLEVIVASDGSDDGTVELVEGYNALEVRLLTLPRQGKNQALNCAVDVASGDILVFSDVDSMFAPDALRHLVAPFADPQVGGVAGDYRHDPGPVGGTNERDYWSIERRLKWLQSRGGSMTSAWGPIYAIRRSHYAPIPTGVTDDYFTSVQVLAAHERLVYEPQAVATGPVADSAQSEFRRKVRIITAGLRGVWAMRCLFNPLEYGFIAIQLFSHKLLRRLMIIPLLVLGITAPPLWSRSWFYKLATVGQVGFHGAALLGFLLQETALGHRKLLRLPFFFDMVYTAAGMALFNLVRGTRHDIWETQPAEK